MSNEKTINTIGYACPLPAQNPVTENNPVLAAALGVHTTVYCTMLKDNTTQLPMQDMWQPGDSPTTSEPPVKGTTMNVPIQNDLWSPQAILRVSPLRRTYTKTDQ